MNRRTLDLAVARLSKLTGRPWTLRDVPGASRCLALHVAGDLARVDTVPLLLAFVEGVEQGWRACRRAIDPGIPTLLLVAIVAYALGHGSCADSAAFHDVPRRNRTIERGTRQG